MKTITVDELMVPLSEYAVVNEEATMYEAIMALEKAQEKYEERNGPHRAVLVVDKDQKVVGRLSQWDVLRSLEPKYSEMGDPGALSRAGFSPQFLNSMLEQYALWDKPLQTICSKAAQLQVKRFMHTPSEGEYVQEKSSLDEAIHKLIMGHHHSLLVTSDKAIVGVLMLETVFKEISNQIKACKI